VDDSISDTHWKNTELATIKNAQFITFRKLYSAETIDFSFSFTDSPINARFVSLKNSGRVGIASLFAR
jgi:hypothetical protein